MSGDVDAGLCSACRHAHPQRSGRGSVFWRCLRAESDPAYPRYPALPVRACPGHAPRQTGGADDDDGAEG